MVGPLIGTCTYKASQKRMASGGEDGRWQAAHPHTSGHVGGSCPGLGLFKTFLHLIPGAAQGVCYSRLSEFGEEGPGRQGCEAGRLEPDLGF